MRDIKKVEAAYFPQPQTIWQEIPLAQAMGVEAAEYMSAWKHDGLMVFASAGEYDDGREWLHISVSRKSRIPSYEDMTRVKRDFLGDDKKGVVVLPEKKNHVNIHDYCLHLFYSADNPLPEFSGKGFI